MGLVVAWVAPLRHPQPAVSRPPPVGSGGSRVAASQPALREHRASLLQDLQLMAKRVSQMGASACSDSLAHLEWLSDQAFNCMIDCTLEGHGAAKDGGGGGRGSDELPMEELVLCGGFAEAAIELTAALPATEDRYATQLRARALSVHCLLALASLSRL